MEGGGGEKKYSPGCMLQQIIIKISAMKFKKLKKEKHELESNFEQSCTKMFQNRSLFLERGPTTPWEVKSIPRLNPDCLVDCFQWNHS